MGGARLPDGQGFGGRSVPDEALKERETTLLRSDFIGTSEGKRACLSAEALKRRNNVPVKHCPSS